MYNSNFFIIVAILSVATFLIRASFVFFSDRLVLNKEVKDLFSFIPAAILPALFMPMTFFFEGVNESLFGKERLIALCLALVVSFYSKNILCTILVGLGVLFFIR